MFDDLIGNDDAKRRIELLTSTGRLPHSLLLTGPEGVGKKRFALETARALVCKEGNGRICGECPMCKRSSIWELPKPGEGDKDDFKTVFFSGQPDIALVLPWKNSILVDAIRDLEREANFRPYEASSRVFIVDDADKLNDSAANALLKTLEEPPDTTYIILVTSYPDGLLPTILSRCQRLRFTPVDRRTVERFLVEEKSYSPQDASIAASLGAGGVGNVLNIDVEKIKELRERMLGLLQSASRGNEFAECLKVSEAMNEAKNKDDADISLDILASLVRDAWSAASGGDLRNEDIAPQIKAIADAADASRFAEWLARIEDLKRSMKVNINKKPAIDSLVTAMAKA